MSGSGHGGKRQGAGRKPGSVKGITKVISATPAPITKASAGDILALQDEYVLWAKHLHSKDPRIAFDALKYLSDKRDGRAFVQPNPHGPGRMNPADDPRLAGLLDKFRPASMTLTQVTVTGEAEPQEQKPVIEQRLT